MTGVAPGMLPWQGVCVCLMLHLVIFVVAEYQYQWKFENSFGGPIWWGVISPLEWAMCKHGRRQSPINIQPGRLLFDKHLGKLYIEKHELPGVLVNSGQLPVLRVGPSPNQGVDDTARELELNSLQTTKTKPKNMAPKITGGPLGAYQYRLSEIVFHFGSDHSVDDEFFTGEVQLMGYNTIYKNYTEALKQPHGIVAIAVMIEIGPTTSSELERLSRLMGDVKFKGAQVPVASVNPSMLLPSPAHHYVTYEGSLTYPGCYETVTWVIMNKPIQITQHDLKTWHELRRTERDEDVPQLMMENHRPIQDANDRLIRTNIQFRNQDSSCVYKDMYYRRNPNRYRYTLKNDYTKRDSMDDSSFVENKIPNKP